MEVNHEEAIYMIQDYDLLKRYSGSRLKVRYNEYDLSKVYLFDSQNETYIDSIDRFDRILVHGPEAEYKRLGKIKAAAKAIDQQRRSEIMAAREKAEKSLKAPLYLEADETAMLMPTLTPKAIKEDNESKLLDDDFIADARDMY